MSKNLAALGLLLTSIAVNAQTPPAPPVPPVPPVPPSFPLIADGLGDEMMMFVSSELGGRSVVKGAPYAATAVSETRQLLSDGNRIERGSSIRLYRDSQGRTRQEHSGGTVFINDVVAGKRWVLDTQRKSARELRMAPLPPIPPVLPVPPVPPIPPVGAAAPPPQPSKPHSQMSAEEARSWGEEMRRWARAFAVHMRGEREERSSERAEQGTQHVRVRSLVTTDNGAVQSHVVTDQVEVIHLRDGHAAFPPLPPMAMMPPGPGATTALGSRDFDGVRADGQKTTWTIAAGRIGNKLPIEIVAERWHSPELKVVLLSRHADPRSGERIYRLENIKRDEPGVDLFKVPADFALKTASPREADRK